MAVPVPEDASIPSLPIPTICRAAGVWCFGAPKFNEVLFEWLDPNKDEGIVMIDYCYCCWLIC